MVTEIVQYVQIVDMFDRTDRGAQPPGPPSMGNFSVLGGSGAAQGSVLGSPAAPFDRFDILFDSIDD